MDGSECALERLGFGGVPVIQKLGHNIFDDFDFDDVI
jgi:hypothetical protein